MTWGDRFPRLRELPVYSEIAARPYVESDPPPRPAPTIDPSVRDAVLACPDRGSTFPASALENEQCGCAERTECRAGLGKTPGRVTLRECLACKGNIL